MFAVPDRLKLLTVIGVVETRKNAEPPAVTLRLPNIEVGVIFDATELAEAHSKLLNVCAAVPFKAFEVTPVILHVEPAFHVAVGNVTLLTAWT